MLNKFPRSTSIAITALLLALGASMTTAAIKAIHNGEKVGTTYPIAEQNAIELIQKKLAKKEKTGELAKIKAEAKKRITANIISLAPVEGLAMAERGSVRLFEPRYTLSETIYDQENRIIAPAGTTINPLEVSPIPFKMFFFDGREEDQITLAKRLAKEYGESFMPILVAGKWDALAKELNQAVYFDQQGKMVESFKVTEVPSLVSQDGIQIRVEAIKP